MLSSGCHVTELREGAWTLAQNFRRTVRARRRRASVAAVGSAFVVGFTARANVRRQCCDLMQMNRPGAQRDTARGYLHSQRAGERVEAVAALAADSMSRVPGDSRPGDASPGR